MTTGTLCGRRTRTTGCSTLAGHTPIAFTSLPPAVPQISEGKLRALAVTSKMRSHALPDVPSMAEAGHPEVEGEGWFAFIVPAGTPKEITTLLHREIVNIITLPDIVEKMAELGFEGVGNTPDEAAALSRPKAPNGQRSFERQALRLNDAAARAKPDLTRRPDMPC